MYIYVCIIYKNFRYWIKILKIYFIATDFLTIICDRILLNRKFCNINIYLYNL